MKRWKLAVLLVVVSLVSFLCGGIFISTLSPEDRISKSERLRGEAVVFFYDTMRELFAGTYDQQEGYVSAEALEVFNAYRASLEPRCWLVNVKESYGAFWGDALFPSGDLIEVAVTKTDKGWVLSLLNHIGTRNYFFDLSEAKWRTKQRAGENGVVHIGFRGGRGSALILSFNGLLGSSGVSMVGIDRVWR